MWGHRTTGWTTRLFWKKGWGAHEKACQLQGRACAAAERTGLGESPEHGLILPCRLKSVWGGGGGADGAEPRL